MYSPASSCASARLRSRGEGLHLRRGLSAKVLPVTEPSKHSGDRATTEHWFGKRARALERLLQAMRSRGYELS